jgi:hypothetical protein
MHKVRRLIIIALQIGAVKIYVATVKALKKKERQSENQVPSPLNANVFFFFLVFESHPIYDQTQGPSVVFLTL